MTVAGAMIWRIWEVSWRFMADLLALKLSFNCFCPLYRKARARNGQEIKFIIAGIIS